MSQFCVSISDINMSDIILSYRPSCAVSTRDLCIVAKFSKLEIHSIELDMENDTIFKDQLFVIPNLYLREFANNLAELRKRAEDDNRTKKKTEEGTPLALQFGTKGYIEGKLIKLVLGKKSKFNF